MTTDIVRRLRENGAQLEQSRAVHGQWIDWLREATDAEREANKAVGDIAHHERSVAMYDERIACNNLAIELAEAAAVRESPTAGRAVDLYGGCLSCSSEQGETHRADCPVRNGDACPTCGARDYGVTWQSPNGIRCQKCGGGHAQPQAVERAFRAGHAAGFRRAETSSRSQASSCEDDLHDYLEQGAKP